MGDTYFYTSGQIITQQKSNFYKHKSNKHARTKQWTGKSIIHKTFEDNYCSLNRASKKIKIHIDIAGIATKLSTQHRAQTMTVHSCLGRSVIIYA